ncbi:MAG TPA: carboxypeptidase-like regulatory domain-containing protein, partial [Blastocatellia bacterium]|nr:carboxypeptidase-like regulatory domain-containing protein [Blastocatellia bacterium]
MRRFRVGALCLILAFMTTAPPALAQTRKAGDSSLRVRALDPLGAAIVAAKVYVKTGEAEARSLDTDERGEALFKNLPPGPHQIRVEAEGFEAQEVSDITLKPGMNTLEIRLEVAGVNEEVVVAEDERERQTDPRGNAFSSVLTAEQIASLPDDPEEFEAAL